METEDKDREWFKSLAAGKDGGEESVTRPSVTKPDIATTNESNTTKNTVSVNTCFCCGSTATVWCWLSPMLPYEANTYTVPIYHHDKPAFGEPQKVWFCDSCIITAADMFRSALFLKCYEAQGYVYDWAKEKVRALDQEKRMLVLSQQRMKMRERAAELGLGLHVSAKVLPDL